MPDRRTFFGFGLGAIQSGLFLLEAYRVGIAKFYIAEVDATLVSAVRAAGGVIAVNVAYEDRVEIVKIPNVTVLNPLVPEDREQLLSAIADADELSTALPSVDFYTRGGANSVAALLAGGLAKRGAKPGVIYTAENDTRAADKLAAALRDKLPRTVQPLNTVIGKMSGVVTDAATIDELKLAPFTPDCGRAILVEAFNRIQISGIHLTDFTRGFEAFEEKDDLGPFEDAKLYGHNAVHALLGYLAHERGIATMDRVRQFAKLLAIARATFLEECGPALRNKHRIADPLFTEAGWTAYSEDLLTRMTNPFLRDSVERVIRDPRRKLGWDDRLIGSIRLALSAGILPVRLARGVRAAMAYGKITDIRKLWPDEVRSSAEAEEIARLLA